MGYLQFIYSSSIDDIFPLDFPKSYDQYTCPKRCFRCQPSLQTFVRRFGYLEKIPGIENDPEKATLRVDIITLKNDVSNIKSKTWWHFFLFTSAFLASIYGIIFRVNKWVFFYLFISRFMRSCTAQRCIFFTYFSLEFPCSTALSQFKKNLKLKCTKINLNMRKKITTILVKNGVIYDAW